MLKHSFESTEYGKWRQRLNRSSLSIEFRPDLKVLSTVTLGIHYLVSKISHSMNSIAEIFLIGTIWNNNKNDFRINNIGRGQYATSMIHYIN